MDPNETLERLRRYAADDTGEDWLDFGPELFQALDSWLSKGGFLPDDWCPGRRPPHGQTGPDGLSWIEDYPDTVTVPGTYGIRLHK